MNKIIFQLSLFLFATIATISNAQDFASTSKSSNSNNYFNEVDNDSTKKERRTATTYKNNLSGHLGSFDPWVGIYYERLILPFWGFDAAIGLIGASIGTKVYFPKLSNGKVSAYTGFSEGILLSVGPKHYIPIGVTYLGNKGFRISLDLGPQIYHDKNEELQLGVSLKIGKSF